MKQNFVIIGAVVAILIVITGIYMLSSGHNKANENHKQQVNPKTKEEQKNTNETASSHKEQNENMQNYETTNQDETNQSQSCTGDVVCTSTPINSTSNQSQIINNNRTNNKTYNEIEQVLNQTELNIPDLPEEI